MRFTWKTLGKVAKQLQYVEQKKKFSSRMGKYFWYSWNKEKVQKKYFVFKNEVVAFFTFLSLHHGKLSLMKNICQKLNSKACFKHLNILIDINMFVYDNRALKTKFFWCRFKAVWPRNGHADSVGVKFLYFS